MANKKHTKKYKKVVAFSVDEDISNELSFVAEKLNMSKSSLIQEALIAYLTEVKKTIRI